MANKRKRSERRERERQESPAGAAARVAAPQESVLKPILTRLAIFAGAMGLFYGITAMDWFRTGFFPWYLSLNAEASAWLLNLFGEQAGVNEVVVYTNKYQLSIRKGCDAIEPCALLIGALLVSPATWRQKMPALLIGLPALLLLNLVRIVSLYFTGVHYPDLFETMHVDVWQPGFVAITLLFWALWAVWAMRQGPSEPAAPEPAG